MYWLAIDPSAAQDGTSVIASYQGQTLTVEDAQNLSSLRIRINDAMLDMDQPITVTFEGATLFEGNVERTIATLAATLAEREDPSLVYSGEVVVDL
jgi:siroheme synthase